MNRVAPEEIAMNAEETEPLIPETVIVSDPEIMSGTPVFAGTRVPVEAMIDYLKAGDTLEEFLDQFPSVSRDRAVAALEQMGRQAIETARAHPTR
jgi:uncharacterized protein (DUF433 family)